jgi:hypothetical protein
MSDPYLAVLNELRELTMKKRAGYSPGEDPFANFRMSQTFGVDPLKGILIRVMDKIARIASLLENPANDKIGESLRDTMLDAGNYLLIGVAFRDSESLDERSRKILDEIEAERQRAVPPITAEEVGMDVSDVFDSSEMDDPTFDCCPEGCKDCLVVARCSCLGTVGWCCQR